MTVESTDNGSRSPHDDSLCSLTNQILTAIAESDNLSVNDLDLLYDVIDPEALDALFAPRADGSSRSVGEVSFQYAGHWVTVSSEGTVEIDSEK